MDQVDLKKYADAADAADKEFARQHPAFLKWWARHPDHDHTPRFAVPARVAWTVATYREQYEEFNNLTA